MNFIFITGAALLLIIKMLVKLFNHFGRAYTMYGTGVCKTFASCGRAAQTVHTHFKEVRRSIGVKVENIADYHIFGNFSAHFKFLRKIYCIGIITYFFIICNSLLYFLHLSGIISIIFLFQ